MGVANRFERPFNSSKIAALIAFVSNKHCRTWPLSVWVAPDGCTVELNAGGGGLVLVVVPKTGVLGMLKSEDDADAGLAKLEGGRENVVLAHALLVLIFVILYIACLSFTAYIVNCKNQFFFPGPGEFDESFQNDNPHVGRGYHRTPN